MPVSPLLELIARRPVLLDGALGTELMKRGLGHGQSPDIWSVERPDAVRDVHRSYFEAGSDAVATNTFGASVLKLAAAGLGPRCAEINGAAAALALSVRPAGRFVAGDIGPTGKFLKPQGEHTEDEFEASFAVQARALAGAGVDFFLIETMYDLREALCAVRACRAAAEIPVFATMTFNRTKRGFFTLMGDSAAACVAAFEALDVPAFGANCTLTGADLAEAVREMRAHTARPLIAQPNAGQPAIGPGEDLVYSQDLEAFAADVPRLLDAGANLVGGCCGTTPDYIRRAAEILKSRGR